MTTISRLRIALGAGILALGIGRSTAAAQGANWPAGRMMGEVAPTTGTLTIAFGDRAGEFRLETLESELTLELFRPALAVPLMLPVQEALEESVVMRDSQAEIRGGRLDESMVVFDLEVLGDVQPLARVELDSTASTPTIRMEATGISMLEPSGQAIHFQLIGPRVFRGLTDDGFQMISPLRQGQKARFAISTRPLTNNDLNALRPPNAAAIRKD